jgi:hypothetical protein
VTYPAAASARRPVRARVDDGLDYMLKDDSGSVPVRAREWICHGLADNAGLPVLEYRPILDGAGRVLFGSRYLLNGGPGGLSGYKILAGSLPLAEACNVLSALYAVDLFLDNWDRHADNLMIEQDATPRIRVMDFSEAPALLDPAHRGRIPAAGTATVNAGRTLRNLARVVLPEPRMYVVSPTPTIAYLYLRYRGLVASISLVKDTVASSCSIAALAG